jgi:hypothetical protein
VNERYVKESSEATETEAHMRTVTNKAELIAWAQSLPDDAQIVGDDVELLLGGGIALGVPTPEGLDHVVEVPYYDGPEGDEL